MATICFIEADGRTVAQGPTRRVCHHLSTQNLFWSTDCTQSVTQPPMHRYHPSPRFDHLPFSISGIALAMGIVLLLAGSVPSSLAQSSERGNVLPARFDANRIYVTPILASGDTLRLFTDTGGGRHPLLIRKTAERLGLAPVDTQSQGRRSIPVVPFPPLRNESSVPDPSDQALVMPNGQRARLLDIGDGMLGQGWFAGRTWTFDYGAEKLLHHRSAEEIPFNPQHTVDLAFQTDSTGRRTGHHARIEATVADSTYAFLLDTGATSVIADSARQAVGWPETIGSSFVTASVFERWRRRHPEWKVVEGASVFRGGTPMIRVAEVTIAGHTVGPVWFERRPDRAFKKKMAQTMDRPVDGALGGSLFQYFRITVDYPGTRAFFR